MRLPALALAVVAWLLATAPAYAADVLSPADGATVPSRPDFLVDYTQGTLEVELAHTPDVLTAGDQAGQFVEPVRMRFMLVGVGGQSPGVALWGQSPGLTAGRYFWHARPNDYATEIARGFVPYPWGSTRTLVVRDEPIVFEGWTLRAHRVARSRCAKRFKAAFRVTGTIAWSDNAEHPKAGYAITLRSGPTRAVLRGSLTTSPGGFSHLVCTNHTAARATVALRDAAGQVTAGAAKQLRLT
jgi:hypothetical protein